MEASSALLVLFYLFSFFTNIHLASVATMATTAQIAKPKPLVLNLIHSKSVLSENDIVLLKTNGYYNDDFPSDLHRVNTGVLFVNFTIGQPPLPQLAVLDTGSSRLWILCHPCQGCKEASVPIFDPSRSTTYTQLICNHPRCVTSIAFRCRPPAPCPYLQSYARGLSSSGVQATEQITLGTEDDGTKIVSDVLIGCASKSDHEDIDDSRFNGVFALGYHTESLVRKLGSKFSYCVGDLSDHDYPYSHLRLGGGIELEGDSTPMEVGGVYRVLLESITLGGERLPVHRHMAVIDTGTVHTRLANGYFRMIQEKIRNILNRLGMKEISFYADHRRLCYRGHTGNIDEDLKEFPVVRLQFAYGGVALELDYRSLFMKGEWQKSFCLAMSPYIDREQTVIGLMAQQNYNMGFDLLGKKLFVQKVDCDDLLDD